MRDARRRRPAETWFAPQDAAPGFGAAQLGGNADQGSADGSGGCPYPHG